MTRILFCNTGWMRKYQGLKQDPIIGGGAYVREHGYGHEIFNFKQSNGFLYGFVQSKSGINVERLGAQKNSDTIDDVLVVWVATDPQGGTFIVGWYKHATVYRKYQSPPPNSNRVHNGEQIGFIVKAKHADCTLLSIDQRVLSVPRRQKGGMGQSNVWYADQPENAQFKQAVLDFITTGLIPAAKKKSGGIGHVWQTDPYKRKKVEEKAIKCTVEHYEGLGYVVDSVEKDNVGWDLEATLENKLLRLEVKGLSGVNVAIEMTPNEYQKMQEQQANYRICVVTNTMGSKPALYVFAYSPDSGAWEDDEGRQLVITEITSARMNL
ncbi:hypothetical protein ANRL3_02267 [Anaerolineae bacterium]|nr:hypothetical protein ANRL3_02267 [Anaerolineae bacterium]